MTSRFVFLIVLFGCGLVAVAGAGTVDQNKALVGRFFEVGNAKNYELLPDFVSEEFTRHSQASPGVTIENREQFARHMRDDLEVFPDSRLEVRQIVGEGDRVAVWGSYLGTYRGSGAGGQLPGRRIDVDFAAFFRVSGDKIAEMWVTWDNLAVQRQLTFRAAK